MSADLLRLARLGARMRWTITRNSLRRRGRALFVLTLVASSIGAMAGFVTFAGSALMDPDRLFRPMFDNSALPPGLDRLVS